MKLILALLMITASFSSHAQFDVMFTQYMHNEMFINPAYAGSREALSLTALHRQQWIGFEGRPITTTFSAHTPLLRNTMGIGISFLNEKIGVTNRNLIYATYAYRIKTGTDGRLSFGLMGGAHLQENRLREVQTTSTNDPQFAANTPVVFTPNFGFGIYYYTQKFFTGISTPRLINDYVKVSGSGEVIRSNDFDFKKLHYYFIIGRVFGLNENFRLKPQLMAKAVNNAPVELDINLSALIRERLWIGASYRTNADASLIAGIHVSPQFLISYSYDYPTTKLNQFTSGSHEIVMSYLFGFSGRKIVSPRYF